MNVPTSFPPRRLRGPRPPCFKRSARGLLALVLSLGLPSALVSQVPEPRGAPPREVQAALIEFMNAPTTLRMAGGTRIPSGTSVRGDVGVLGGALYLSGTIEGDLVVVNGDLEVGEGARVLGDVYVVGGRLRGGGDADWLGGTLLLEPGRMRYRIRGERIEAEPSRDRELQPFLVADFGAASIRPLVRSAGAYNRTEGLPVELGGTLETRSRNALRVDLAAVWRTASGLDLEQENLGHRFEILQELGGRGEARLRFSHHDRIVPVESRGVSDLESGLSTFLLRRDLRDHFREDGWSLRLEATPLEYPVRPWVAYREETHAFAPIRDPWSLRSTERAWRPQPLVAEGSIRSLAMGALLDTRDDPRDPAVGWWIDAWVRRRVGGSAALPPELVPGAPSLALATDGHLDLRRYNRLGPEARLNLQLLFSGAVDGSALPPQHQRSLGGEGSLPGHPRFALSCGAREETLTRPGTETDPDASEDQAVYPAYGCDAVAMARLEFQGRLPFGWRSGPESGEWEVDSLLSLRPAWTVFAGVGRGWSHADGPGTSPDPGASSSTRADVGAGLFVGPLGVYWSWPLNWRDRGLNFFVRLSHRF
jgi:hypothetical protein